MLVALTLSGGGSRAIAFHLGCLRALESKGCLRNVSVISSVSGGSVITALYAYRDDSFDEFETRVRVLLKRGLLRRALGHTLLPWTLAKLGISLFILPIWNIPIRGINRILRRDSDLNTIKPLATLTDGVHFALEKEFKGLKITDVRRRALRVVINACDLRTGTSFRFGSEKSGNWQLGHLAKNNVDLSLAVAASAAYPLVLAPIRRRWKFVKGSESREEEVALTDGGVFENLGTSCVEPVSDSSVKSIHYPADYILCCSAGTGAFERRPFPTSFLGRMSMTFETVFKKGQDAGLSRLFMHKRSGDIRGFLLSYLGMQDVNVPNHDSLTNFVQRGLVQNYPTNFNAMKQNDIDALVKRGEQLTSLLLDANLPKHLHPELYRS